MKSQGTHNPSTKRTSDLLKDTAQAPDHGDIAVGDFVTMLGGRSFALTILILSLPNALPVPGIPGVSTITGVLIFLIGLQILYGRTTIWLPHIIADKHFRQKPVTKIITKVLPIVKWLERFLHPRMTILCKSTGRRFIAFIIVIMSLILSLPVFGGNFLPGLSIALLALALLEEDGLFVIFSVVFAFVTSYLMYELLFLVVNSLFSGFID